MSWVVNVAIEKIRRSMISKKFKINSRLLSLIDVKWGYLRVFLT